MTWTIEDRTGLCLESTSAEHAQQRGDDAKFEVRKHIATVERIVAQWREIDLVGWTGDIEPEQLEARINHFCAAGRANRDAGWQHRIAPLALTWLIHGRFASRSAQWAQTRPAGRAAFLTGWRLRATHLAT